MQQCKTELELSLVQLLKIYGSSIDRKVSAQVMVIVTTLTPSNTKNVYNGQVRVRNGLWSNGRRWWKEVLCILHICISGIHVDLTLTGPCKQSSACLDCSVTTAVSFSNIMHPPLWKHRSAVIWGIWQIWRCWLDLALQIPQIHLPVGAHVSCWKMKFDPWRPHFKISGA